MEGGEGRCSFLEPEAAGYRLLSFRKKRSVYALRNEIEALG